MKRNKKRSPGDAGMRNMREDPYSMIEIFFFSASPDRCRAYIFSMLISACSQPCWSEADPGSLLEFEQDMDSLIGAVYRLSGRRREKPGLKNKAILGNATWKSPVDLSLFSGWPKYDAVWEYFPRHLSKSEFLNPYIVFEKMFMFRNVAAWRKHLRRIVIDALSVVPGEPTPDFNPLETNFLLQKMVEAAYLVYVRTQENSTRRLINRFYKPG